MITCCCYSFAILYQIFFEAFSLLREPNPSRIVHRHQNPKGATRIKRDMNDTPFDSGKIRQMLFSRLKKRLAAVGIRAYRKSYLEGERERDRAEEYLVECDKGPV